MAMPRLVTAMKCDIGIRMLGPVEARAASGWLTTPPQQRLLLALLALHVGQVIPGRDMIDAIWPQTPPISARASIQVMVTRLRQILASSPGGLVERCGDGYRLLMDPHSIDLHQFRSLAQAGRDAPDAIDAIAAFDQGLALWRGPALADVPGTARIEAIRVALADERLSAMEDRISALLGIGQNRQAAEELTSLVVDHPWAERPAGLLMIALFRCGRQADALQVFRDLRERLNDELAVEPGRELQHLHQQILAGDLASSPSTNLLIRPGEQPAFAQGLATAGRTSVPRQLPAAVAHFTGRRAELLALDGTQQYVGMADGTPAVAVISGTAGVGKTALALHWAHRVAGHFPDGQLYVNLRAFGASRRPLRTAEAIGYFLDALHVPADRRPKSTEAQAALYRSVVAEKQMLLVLDNATHEEQVRPLLPGAAGCLVLITSRKRLAGLAAREGAILLNLGVLSQSEAIELLADRLGAESMMAAPEAASQLAALCARLPLALSVAAVRASERPNLGLGALTTQLQDPGRRLDVLDVGERGGSVRAVLSWSYQSLSEPAARMFRLLGVHPGPDIGLAAAASLIGYPAAQTSRILAELVSAHVVTEHSSSRWTFHDLLRAYANEQALSSEDQAEREAATLRVLDYYVHSAWSASAMLMPGHDPTFELLAPNAGAQPESISSVCQAMAWYEAEHQVLLAATQWAATARFDAYAWRVPWALADYLWATGRPRDQAVTMRTALSAALREGDLAGQARAHCGLGSALTMADPGSASLDHLHQALGLYRDLDDRVGQASVRFQLGNGLCQRGRIEVALSEAHQALSLTRGTGHDSYEASALNMAGWLHAQLGHHELALRSCRQALALHRAVRNGFGEAATLDSIGYVSYRLGNFAQAGELYQRALQLSSELGWRSGEAEILDHLGDNSQAAAHPGAARDFWQRALVILDDLPHADASGIRQKLGKTAGRNGWGDTR
jgi:DNA-binding SARP family transcriptional activator/tetratricopeptide (TPR) repeat protein